MAMTLNQVAKDAGVALDTARKALRGDPTVRSYLKDRVLESADRLNYRPNHLARALKEQQLNLVPLSVIDLGTPYFGRLARELSEELVGAGFEPALCTDPRRLMELNQTYATCASILAYQLSRSELQELTTRQPVVTLHSHLPLLPGVSNVAIDFQSAYAETATALVADGRRHVAYLSPHYVNSLPKGQHDDKYDGLVQGLEAHGLQLATDVFASVPELMAYLRTHEIDAICCQNDLFAAELMAQLVSTGRWTPEEIRLVGCDATLDMAGIWTLRPDYATIARETIHLLQRLLKDKKDQDEVISQPELVTTHHRQGEQGGES